MKKHGKIQPFLSVCHLGVDDSNSDKFVFGTAGGQLYVFEGRECIGTISDYTSPRVLPRKKGKNKNQDHVIRHAHRGAINALSFCKMYNNRVVRNKDPRKKFTYVIISGGRSGWVKIWDAGPVINKDELSEYRETEGCNCGKDHYDFKKSERFSGSHGHFSDCYINNPGDLCSFHCKPLAKFNVHALGTALGDSNMVWQIRSVSCLSQPPDENGFGLGNKARLVLATRGAQIWEYNLQNLQESNDENQAPYNTGEILHQSSYKSKRKSIVIKVR
jgi:hypothetical protein